MVKKNTKTDKLMQNKLFAKRDTSYSSFWLYNTRADMQSEHFKDSFVNFYNDKELLSEFNPGVAKNVISFWSEPKDIILDPFTGRTRALVSYAMDRSYVGYDVSLDVINYMTDKFVNLGLYKKENFNVDIINDDCINANKTFKNESFDMIFSCPPYWNLEKYESCDGQLSDIKDYADFIDALVDRLNKSVELLKCGKYMCIVIGDFRRNGKYISIHADLMQRMRENKYIELHDVIVTQNLPFHTAAFYFGSKKKKKYTAKAHEYLLVWKKNEM